MNDKSKQYLLIIKLKGGKGVDSQLFFYKDTLESVREKIKECKKEFEDRYRGYVVYSKRLEEHTEDEK